jgi:hypothetical protein
MSLFGKRQARSNQGVLIRGGEAMSPWVESDIRDARVDSQKARAEEDVLRQKKIFSRRIPLFSGTRLISFSPNMRRKMPCSQVSAFMFSRTYTYEETDPAPDSGRPAYFVVPALSGHRLSP